MAYEEALLILLETIMPVDKENEALEKAIEALRKQIPKKVIWRFGGDGLPYPYCSACGKSVMRSDYCDNCGQKLEF